MSTSRKILPTKINLIMLRRQYRFARSLKRLLENKREVLLLYLRTYSSEYEKVFNEVAKSLSEVYSDYLNAVSIDGFETIKSIADSQKSSIEVKSELKYVFGVKIPVVKLDENSIPDKPITQMELSPYLSKSYDELQSSFKQLLALIELESTIRSLVAELRRTQRLINALDNYVIPSYLTSIKYIRLVLEDRMREEFLRLKMIRRILRRRVEQNEAK